MPDERTVQQAEAGDLEVVRDLTIAAYEPYTALFGAPPRRGRTASPSEDYAPRIAAGQVWLLREGADIIGLMVVEPHTDKYLIYSIAIRPDRKGQGHGSFLLDWVERRAREAKVAELRLFTNARMTRNISLYAANGYLETSRHPNPHRADITQVNMAKPLS